MVDEVNNIIAGINGDWIVVHTVSVGNKLVRRWLNIPL